MPDFTNAIQDEIASSEPDLERWSAIQSSTARRLVKASHFGTLRKPLSGHTALREMTRRLLRQHDYGRDRVETIANLVLLRERRGSTVYGTDFAVPHARSKSIRRTHVGWFVLKHPICFDRQTGAEVALVVLLLEPARKSAKQSNMMNALASVLATARFREGIMRAASAHSLAKAVREALCGGICAGR